MTKGTSGSARATGTPTGISGLPTAETSTENSPQLPMSDAFPFPGGGTMTVASMCHR
jgi:hypothetical protein